jgi:hypothetical protein
MVLISKWILGYDAAWAGGEDHEDHGETGDRMKRMLFWLLSILGTGWVPVAEADIFRWVDAKGVIHFSNAPNSPNYQLYMHENRDTRPPSTSLGVASMPVSRERLSKYDPLIQEMARRHGVDECLVTAVIKVESNFDPGAVSRKGAQGLMQLMPETARELGVRNSFDPVQNMDGGVRYLRYMLEFFEGRLPLALAAYNAGRDAVLQHRGIPPYAETQQYVKLVIQHFDQLQREFGKTSKVQTVASRK